MQSGLSKRLGLPLSVQFVGRAYDEITLLRVAAAYERVTQWSLHRPAMMYQTGARQPAAATA
jgi:aspartyl-tRNA(Asn)/glutamyl-tRNA(Gln) amidotransferase subunit A